MSFLKVMFKTKSGASDFEYKIGEVNIANNWNPHAIEEKTITMKDLVKELNFFLTTNRKDILKDSGKISHECAMSHVKSEYNKYKNRISLKPSDVELHYLESIKTLEKIDMIK